MDKILSVRIAAADYVLVCKHVAKEQRRLPNATVTVASVIRQAIKELTGREASK